MAKKKTEKPSGLTAALAAAHGKVNYGVLTRFLLGASLVLLAAMAAQIGWERFAQQPEFMVYPSTFQLDTPKWATPELADELRRVKGLKKRYSIFEFGLTHKIAKAYEQCPWVYKVLRIRREFPNTIRMELMLRKPAAVVEFGRTLYLVDEDAVCLPRKFYVWPHPSFDVPRVLRAGLRVLPQAGQVWDDPGVKAGVRLAKFLASRKMLHKFKITTIDASNVGRPNGRRDSELVLITEQHTRILWGSPARSHVPGELTDEQKLVNLVAVGEAENYDFRRLREIDVRGERPYGRTRRVAAAQ